MLVENLEISSYCNANCSWCGRKYMDRPKRFIKIETVDAIARKLEGKQKVVWLHFWGEPLLHPHLFDIMYVLKSYGISTCFYTNGKLLTPELNTKLSKAPIRTIAVTINMFAPKDNILDLMDKAPFKVEAVFLRGVEDGKINIEEYSAWCHENGIEECYSDYSDPLWEIKPKKCIYQLPEGLCALKKSRKANVTAEGRIIGCVKDYGDETYLGEIDQLDTLEYKDLKCPFI